MEKGKVLLIEDDKRDAGQVSSLLQGEGYTVRCAYNGRDGLERAGEEKFNLVILDLLLPDMPGEEVCSLLKRKRRYRKIPVIVLSVKDEIEDIERLFGRGADDYIIKPARPEHLLNRVEKHVSRKEA